jgi:hypothetical protein
MRTEKVDKHDVFPAMASFPEAITNVAEVRNDVTALRLVSKAQNLSLLRELSRLERLWCFDVNTRSAPIIGSLSSLRRLYVDGMRLDGLSWLSGLARLDVLSLESCTRVVSLEELAPFRGVSGLGITHFPKVHSLQPLCRFDSLGALVVAGGMWSRMTVETLSPLSRLHRLRFLHLTNLKALDESLGPLADLTGLENLELPNFYPVEEFAKLSARLRKTACTWFASSTPLGSVQCPKCSQTSMVMLTGKGMPTLCASCDIVRVQKHDDLFKSIAARAA